MSHNLNHVEEYDESTKTNYRLLLLASTPEGLLRLLPNIIKSLEKDKTCKTAYNKIKAQLIIEDEELHKQKQEVVDWIKKKLMQLQSLKCSKSFGVKKTIDQAKLILSGKTYEINSGGYLSVLIWYFEQACRSVAFYGPDPEFKKWLKVTTREHTMIFTEPVLKSPIFDMIIKPSTSEGKQIKKRLGHGFIKAFIQSGKGFSGGEGPLRYSIEWGNVDSIAYPEALQIWLQNSNLQRWQVQSDHKAENNLRFLLLLCQFVNLTPVPLSSLPQPKSVFEAEALCNQQLLQYYLSGFKSDNWDKAPLSREDILSKLDRLLVFLRIKDNATQANTRGHRVAKDDAREFIQTALNNKWDELEKERKKPDKYQVLRIAVLQELKFAPDDIRNAISDTLIEQEIRKFAKSKKWKPVRGKDFKKRHIA